MTRTITIPNPRILEREKEFVLIPKDEYKTLLRIKSKGIREVTLTAREKRAIAQSEKELKSGEYFTLDELGVYLDRTRAKARR